MLNFLICVVLSVLVSLGISTALVEKSDRWPLRKVRIILQKFIHNHIYWKAAQILSCSACFSFWCCLFTDSFIFILSLFLGHFYFFWPASGFIALFAMWFVIEFLNAIDRGKE